LPRRDAGSRHDTCGNKQECYLLPIQEGHIGKVCRERDEDDHADDGDCPARKPLSDAIDNHWTKSEKQLKPELEDIRIVDSYDLPEDSRQDCYA
jgi:hypothetical protein